MECDAAGFRDDLAVLGRLFCQVCVPRNVDQQQGEGRAAGRQKVQGVCRVLGIAEGDHPQIVQKPAPLSVVFLVVQIPDSLPRPLDLLLCRVLFGSIRLQQPFFLVGRFDNGVGVRDEEAPEPLISEQSRDRCIQVDTGRPPEDIFRDRAPCIRHPPWRQLFGLGCLLENAIGALGQLDLRNRRTRTLDQFVVELQRRAGLQLQQGIQMDA